MWLNLTRSTLSQDLVTGPSRCVQEEERGKGPHGVTEVPLRAGLICNAHLTCQYGTYTPGSTFVLT